MSRSKYYILCFSDGKIMRGKLAVLNCLLFSLCGLTNQAARHHAPRLPDLPVLGAWYFFCRISELSGVFSG